jgi:hypothetical protein
MRYNRKVLFTTNYAVTYDGWQKLDMPVEEQFRDVYLWCNYYVYTWTSNYYLLVRIVDNNNKILYEGYIRTIDEYNNVKKKLGFNKCAVQKCTEQSVVYFVDEFGNYLTNEFNYFLTE